MVRQLLCVAIESAQEASHFVRFVHRWPGAVRPITRRVAALDMDSTVSPTFRPGYRPHTRSYVAQSNAASAAVAGVSG